GSDDDVDAGLGIRIASLADGRDPAVTQADIGLVDAGDVDDQRVGDDGVDGAVRATRLPLAHAVANDLAAAELHLFAIDREILLDLDEEFRVGETYAVARGRTVHVGIVRAGNSRGHQSAPMIFC